MERISGKTCLRQLFLDNWSGFRKAHPKCITETIEENVEKMMNCRDPRKMGFAMYQCKNHPNKKVIRPHSCKSRFCNSCGKVQNDNWAASCHETLPNTEYYHIILTIPQQLRNLLRTERKLLDALFRASADTLLSFYKEKSVTPAMMIALHTFGRDMKWNPHIHMIVSAGGLTKKDQWKKVTFIPFKMLQKRWKVLLLNALKRQIRSIINKNPEHPNLKPFLDDRLIDNFFHDLYAMNWYAHRSDTANIKSTINYVGRYAKRPPIAETRILDYFEEKITFVYRDHRSKSDVSYRLPVSLFIERLIQHIPPKGFRVVRYYGLLANRVISKSKFTLQKIFGITKQFFKKLSWRQRQTLHRGHDPLLCSICKQEMSLSFLAFFSRKNNGLVFRHI